MASTRDITVVIERHLRQLCSEIGSRPVGSEANRRAQGYIAQAMAAAGCVVEEQSFPCLDWQTRPASLASGDAPLAVRVNPFSPSIRVTAPTAVAGSVDELSSLDLAGKIAVLHGELAAEALFPKNFPFFSVEAHQRILEILETGMPLAVIMVGSQPAPAAPLIEDGDFALPSVTVAAEDGRRLLACPGAPVSLSIETLLRPSRGANVIGRKPGTGGQKIIICAHYDTKHGTPGALDNAAGVAALLALAETAPVLAETGLEFIAFDGEEYYSVPGEVEYLARYGQELGAAQLAINIDGVGLREAGNTIALFDCPEAMVAKVNGLLKRTPNLVQVEPWPEGDHTLFWSHGVPSIAFTSRGSENLIGALIHTPLDRIDCVSPCSVAGVVAFVRELLSQ